MSASGQSGPLVFFFFFFFFFGGGGRAYVWEELKAQRAVVLVEKVSTVSRLNFSSDRLLEPGIERGTFGYHFRCDISS